MATTSGYGGGLYGGGAADVPTLEAVAAELGKTEDNIERAYNAEIIAQALACRVDPYSEDLAAALIRRVKRAKAMEALPLGVILDEAGSVRVGYTDGEIRRLEAPYRRLAMG